jgi:hypothetical protein
MTSNPGQLSFLSCVDLDPSAQTEEIEIDGYKVLLTYLDKIITYNDIATRGQTWVPYRERGGWVYRIIGKEGVICEQTNPEPSKDVVLAVIKIEIRIIKKQQSP